MIRTIYNRTVTESPNRKFNHKLYKKSLTAGDLLKSYIWFINSIETRFQLIPYLVRFSILNEQPISFAEKDALDTR